MQTFPHTDLTLLHEPVNNKLLAIEPKYEGIPPGALRRMGKSVRMGMGAALPLLKLSPAPDGIIIGTTNAGFEDSFHFLKQIVDYNEGTLTPGSFVQSTPNALAAQLSMAGSNKGYNITHVHLGLAFENAMIDAGMRIKEHPGHNYLLGAVDDSSSFNHNINVLAGWFKTVSVTVEDLYNLHTPGSIAGEGAAMFLVNGKPAGAIAQLQAISTIHSDDVSVVNDRLKWFLDNCLSPGEKIDLLISGEDGDSRLQKYYTSCEELVGDDVDVVRFKHMCGEYPTSAAIALWLACYILQKNPIPQHAFKKHRSKNEHKNILIYNNHKSVQNSFILVKGVYGVI